MKKINRTGTGLIAAAVLSTGALAAPSSAVPGGGTGGWTPHKPAEASHSVWDCELGFYVQWNVWENMTNADGKVISYRLTEWHPTISPLAGSRDLTSAERAILGCDDRPTAFENRYLTRQVARKNAVIERKTSTIERLRAKVRELRNR